MALRTGPIPSPKVKKSGIALLSLQYRTGLITVHGESTSEPTAETTSRCRRTRSMSPMPEVCRDRAYASAVVPSTSWQPFLMSSPASLSFMFVFGHTSMPPTASTMPGHAAHPDLDVVVDADAGVLLDGLHEQLGAAVGVGGVDLAAGVAGDVDDRVARDGEQQVRARSRCAAA